MSAWHGEALFVRQVWTVRRRMLGGSGRQAGPQALGRLAMESVAWAGVVVTGEGSGIGAALARIISIFL